MIQTQETYRLNINLNAVTTDNGLIYYGCQIHNSEGEKLVNTGGHRQPQQAVKTALSELTQTFHLGSM